MHSPSKILARSITATALLISTSSLAHHPMGGETPDTYLNGFISGLAHPVIGVDHLAFIIGVGIVLGFGALRGVVAPIALVAAAVAGTVLGWSGFAVPGTEVMVALSLLCVAATIFFKPQYRQLLIVMGAATAFFHGQAYAGAILGAETSPLIAYLTGFTVVQVVIAAGAYFVTRWVVENHQNQVAFARATAGTAIAGIGLLSVVAMVMA